MLPQAIAAHLVGQGFDTQAVVARPDLRGLPDEELLQIAAQEGRVLVTANISDFMPLGNAWASRGQLHQGLVLISSKTFPMERRRNGRIASALIRLGKTTGWPAPGQYVYLRP